MVYILGRNFADTLQITKVLTSLYGISRTSTSYLSRRAPSHPIPNLPSKTTSSGVKYSAYKPSPARVSGLAQLLAKHHIHPTATVGELPEAQLTSLTQSLSLLTIENDLRRKVVLDIERLRDLGTYRGRRHAMNLPVRGQNTRSQIRNARKLNRVDRKG